MHNVNVCGNSHTYQLLIYYKMSLQRTYIVSNDTEKAFQQPSEFTLWSRKQKETFHEFE